MGELVQFGKELRKFINSKEVFALLPEGDWGAGGCWELAEALKRFLGEDARLIAIASSKNPVEHVVVEWLDMYFDYNGAQTEQELLENLRNEGYASPQIVSFTKKLKQNASRGGIPCDPWLVKNLLEKLQKNFGYTR